MDETWITESLQLDVSNVLIRLV